VGASVSVFGAAGFTGALTARLLHRHPYFELSALTARSDSGRRLDEIYPYHRVPLMLEELDLDRHAEVDAAVVAYPHGAAAEVVSDLRDRGVRVVDLSADFRLRDPEVYAQWYREHPSPELIADAVYGLPERCSRSPRSPARASSTRSLSTPRRASPEPVARRPSGHTSSPSTRT
jgi:N-acetyl-gamma-glutamyl-phosphate reductase